MILVTHEMSFAEKVANKIIYMRDGLVWEMGGPEILSNPATQELQEFVGIGL
jgi:polar amino acid transport system ATP-binding protein